MIIAGTGHRPDKLGGYGDDVFDRLVRLGELAIEETRPDSLITGMALGWDQALAQAALNKGVPYMAAVPCEGQDRLWPKESQATYNRLLVKAAEVKVVSPGPYAAWKMAVRNKFMVAQCDLVVALHNGTPGGTAGCLEYAGKAGKTVRNYWQEWEKSCKEPR